jgi:hypothetical protein
VYIIFGKTKTKNTQKKHKTKTTQKKHKKAKNKNK